MSDFGVSFGVDSGMPPVMIAIIAVFAIILLGVIGRALSIWIRNNNSPRETVEAKVVTKRMKVQGFGRTMASRNTVTGMGSSTYTHYFVTFELEKGKRLELGVKDAEYGMLAEGDQGMLSYQGTRYLGFEQK